MHLNNSDKGSWCETYDEKEHGLDRMVHSFRACYCGRPGVGKSLIMKNNLLSIQTSNRPFFEVYVIQPTTSTEWDDIDPTGIFTELPNVESFVDEDEKNPVKKLLIFDDYDLTVLSRQQKTNLSMLFRYFSSHKSCSVMLSYQSFFDIPPLIRKLINYFYLWKTNNIEEMSIISKRVGLSKNVLKVLFQKYCPDKHDFLVIDMVTDTIRKNIYEIIPRSEYENL
jgi:hypothetical protein